MASNIRFAAAASGDPGRVGKDSVPAPADGESAMIVVHVGPAARQLCPEAVVLLADRAQRSGRRCSSGADPADPAGQVLAAIPQLHCDLLTSEEGRRSYS